MADFQLQDWEKLMDDNAALPSAIRSFTKGGWSRRFTIEVSKSSMHEQPEAMLELRAWLQRHWPDGLRHLGKIV